MSSRILPLVSCGSVVWTANMPKKSTGILKITSPRTGRAGWQLSYDLANISEAGTVPKNQQTQLPDAMVGEVVGVRARSRSNQ